MPRREGQFALGLLEGLVGSASKQLEARQQERLEEQKQRNRLAQILAAARAQAQAQQEFPSAEEQTRQRSLELITKLAQPRFGAGRIGPPTGEEGQVVSQRQRELQSLMSLLGIRQPFGQAVDITPTISALKALGLQPAGATLSATGEPTFRFAPPRPPPGAAKAANVIQQARASQAQINEIFQRAETELPPATIPGIRLPEGVEALLGGGIFGRRGAAALGFNERARAFLETQVANARQVIRGLGEVGVLTDRDVADAVKLLPASTDSPTVRQKKLEGLNSLIESKINVYQAKETPLESASTDEDFIRQDEDFIRQLESQGYTVEPVP